MKKAFYSEILDKYSEDEKALAKAEQEYLDKKAAADKLKSERADRAKEVEDAYKHYYELLHAFVKDYGSFHMSLSTADDFLDRIRKFF